MISYSVLRFSETRTICPATFSVVRRRRYALNFTAAVLYGDFHRVQEQLHATGLLSGAIQKHPFAPNIAEYRVVLRQPIVSH